MSYFKTGDLVFLSDWNNNNPDPTSGSVATLYQGIYLRELTSDELSSAGLTGPSSYVANFTVLDSTGTPLVAPWSESRNNVVIVNDAKIIGAIHTGIDSSLLADVSLPLP